MVKQNVLRGEIVSSFKTIYTIGHSNHSMTAFLDFLKPLEIEVIVDVRSNPYTRYSIHFNHEPLKAATQKAGLKYLFLGRELGGKPKEKEFYDDEGYVVYERLREAERFKEGLERLIKGAHQYNIVLMCGEENPSGCHRRHLIARTLFDRQIDVLHIRSDGRQQSEADLAADERDPDDNIVQLSLFS
ncbi:MAG: DUF488 domain-containing protein [Cyanobacteria bacterium]|nr:DUF488 domain-containing protein [Cyanobacteriota bacterium]